MSNPFREGDMSHEAGDRSELLSARVQTARNNLEQAKVDRDAQDEDKRSLWDMKVDEAQRKLDDAEADLADYLAELKKKNEGAQ